MLKASASVTTNVDAAAAVERGVTDGLLDAMDAGFERSQAEVPTDRGTLLQSGYPPQANPDGSVEFGYRADYARHVEFGTRPHFPPIEPLKGWARRVLGDESAAWAIQQKIGREGTDAQPFIRPAIATVKAKLRARGLSPYIEDVI